MSAHPHDEAPGPNQLVSPFGHTSSNGWVEDPYLEMKKVRQPAENKIDFSNWKSETTGDKDLDTALQIESTRETFSKIAKTVGWYFEAFVSEVLVEADVLPDEKMSLMNWQDAKPKNVEELVTKSKSFTDNCQSEIENEVSGKNYYFSVRKPRVEFQWGKLRVIPTTEGMEFHYCFQFCAIVELTNSKSVYYRQPVKVVSGVYCGRKFRKAASPWARLRGASASSATARSGTGTMDGTMSTCPTCGTMVDTSRLSLYQTSNNEGLDNVSLYNSTVGALTPEGSVTGGRRDGGEPVVRYAADWCEGDGGF